MQRAAVGPELRIDEESAAAHSLQVLDDPHLVVLAGSGDAQWGIDRCFCLPANPRWLTLTRPATTWRNRDQSTIDSGASDGTYLHDRARSTGP